MVKISVTVHDMLVRLILGIIFFIVTLSPCYSSSEIDDSTRVPLSLGIKAHYGFIIIHSRDLRPIQDSYPFGIEANLMWHFNKEKSYDKCLCFPRLGVSFTYWNFDNPEVLGHGLNLLFFIEPFWGLQHRVSVSFRFGLGLSYTTHPYDAETNPDNMSYSTYLGFPLSVAATLNYRITPGSYLNISANYNHISNGGMNEPNKGINYPTISLGFDYYFRRGNYSPYIAKDWKTGVKQRNLYYIEFFVTANQSHLGANNKRYPVLGIAFRFSRQVSRINAINIGIEGLSDWVEKEKIKIDNSSIDHYLAGILIGNDFLLGKFIFYQQFGLYVHNPYKSYSCFQRYGLLFRINAWLTTGIGLKAHGHVADFLDLKMGIIL